MRSHNLTVLGLILLATCAHSTMIITDKAPAMLDIGGGDTMLVFDEDIGEDDLSALSQARGAAASSETQETSQTVQPVQPVQSPTTISEEAHA